MNHRHHLLHDEARSNATRSNASGATTHQVDPRDSLLRTVGMQARSFTAAVRSRTPGVAPDFYSDASLVSEIETLCDPAVDVTDERALNVAVKYFFAYVHEGAEGELVPYGELEGLYEQFSRHQSLNEPGDDVETMNRLRQWSSVLRVLADAARAAHVIRAVVGQRDLPKPSGPYVGVDIGAGTGVMLLAQQIQARRNGFMDIQSFGFQSDPVSGERTHDLVRSLGAGSLMLGDPARAGAYGLLKGRLMTYVANETVAGMQQPLRDDTFFAKYRAFFSAVEDNADGAAFFPEGLIAHCGLENASVILAKENGFQVPGEYADAEFVPQGLIMEGKVLPMHKLGEDFHRFLT